MKRIITTKENTQVEVKVKEYKRAIRNGVNEEAIVEMLKPAVKEDFLTAQDIAEIGSYFTISNQVQSWMSKANIDPNLKLAIEALRAYNPDKLLHTLNTLSAERDYFAVIVGKLSDRLTMPTFPTSRVFDLSLVRIYMAGQIISTMIDLKYINLTEKLEFVQDEDTGKSEWKTQQLLTFGKETKQSIFKVSGIALTP